MIAKANLWYYLILIFKITGPNLPFNSTSCFNLYGGTLVTSPTNRGVILIGGTKNGQNNPYLYELSGDSEDNLTWSFLDHELNTGRSFHVSFPIPNKCIPLEIETQKLSKITCTII